MALMEMLAMHVHIYIYIYIFLQLPIVLNKSTVNMFYLTSRVIVFKGILWTV